MSAKNNETKIRVKNFRYEEVNTVCSKHGNVEVNSNLTTCCVCKLRYTQEKRNHMHRNVISNWNSIATLCTCKLIPSTMPDK